MVFVSEDVFRWTDILPASACLRVVDSFVSNDVTPYAARTIKENQAAGEIQVAIVAGFHLFPFRTEKLSPPAPMVLHTRGRVGSRRFQQDPSEGILEGLLCYMYARLMGV